MNQALIIEDDRNIVELLAIHLKDIGFEATRAYTVSEGMHLGLTQTFQLIVLDLMLPGGEGLEICKKIRAEGITTPVLILTAKSEEIDKVLGLEMGADDYLTKPFGIREFQARVKAVVRRSLPAHAQPHGGAVGAMQFESLMIEPDMRRVSIRGQRVELSPKEFELLVLLASHPGRSYDREELLKLIWGYDYEGMAHTVNAHINRLRSKIEPDMQTPTYILTTWGIGYRFNENL